MRYEFRLKVTSYWRSFFQQDVTRYYPALIFTTMSCSRHRPAPASGLARK